MKFRLLKESDGMKENIQKTLVPVVIKNETGALRKRKLM